MFQTYKMLKGNTEIIRKKTPLFSVSSQSLSAKAEISSLHHTTEKAVRDSNKILDMTMAEILNQQIANTNTKIGGS